ncbi:hypothetical protein H9P43_009504 [Blastocladiella emersonii ATCC 22665]|nr:hypothetical protein H9P43_009504 [Blastocladiella emersonii ATCC 22665]
MGGRLINPGLNIVLLHDVRGAGHFFGATIDVEYNPKLGDDDVFLTNFVEIVENLAGCAVTTSHYPPNFYPQVDGCEDCLLYVMLFAELIASEKAAGAPYPMSREAPMFGADLDCAGTWPLLKYEWYFRSDASQVARRRAFARVLNRRLVNLKAALDTFILATRLYCRPDLDSFNPALACAIHKVIGRDIITNAGQYHQREALPAGGHRATGGSHHRAATDAPWSAPPLARGYGALAGTGSENYDGADSEGSEDINILDDSDDQTGLDDATGGSLSRPLSRANSVYSSSDLGSHLLGAAAHYNTVGLHPGGYAHGFTDYTSDDDDAVSDLPGLDIDESTLTPERYPAIANTLVTNVRAQFAGDFADDTSNFSPPAAAGPNGRRRKRRDLYNTLSRAMETMMRRDSYGFFTAPVNASEVPEYLTIIEQPMDLGTMRDKIRARLYTSLDQFEADFRLVVDNCKTFNAPDSVYWKAADKLDAWGSPWFAKEATYEHTIDEHGTTTGVAAARIAAIGSNSPSGSSLSKRDTFRGIPADEWKPRTAELSLDPPYHFAADGSWLPTDAPPHPLPVATPRGGGGVPRGFPPLLQPAVATTPAPAAAPASLTDFGTFAYSSTTPIDRDPATFRAKDAPLARLQAAVWGGPLGAAYAASLAQFVTGLPAPVNQWAWARMEALSLNSASVAAFAAARAVGARVPDYVLDAEGGGDTAEEMDVDHDDDDDAEDEWE